MSLLLHCDVIKTPSVQTWFVYFFVSVQPLSTNFGLTVLFIATQSFVQIFIFALALPDDSEFPMNRDSWTFFLRGCHRSFEP